MPPDTRGITSAPDLGHQFGRRCEIGLHSRRMRFDVRDALAKFSQEARTKPAILNTEPSQIGLAFRTRPTAPTQACTQTGAATTSENDPIRAERLRGRAWGGATS